MSHERGAKVTTSSKEDSAQSKDDALAESHSRLDASLLRLQLVHSIGHQIARLRSIEALLETTVRMIRATFGYYAASIALVEGNRIVCKAGAGGNPSWQPRGESLGINEGLMGASLREAKSKLVRDTSKDPEFLVHPALPETRSELVIPLFGSTRAIGVINLEADQIDAFDQQDQIAMEALADLLGVAIENANLYEELRADNVRLQEMDRIKSEFVAMVGHDIRNPLTVIRGYAEMLQDAGLPQSMLPKNAERIIEEVDEVTHMADQMLALFQIEALAGSYIFEPVAIEPLIRKLIPFADTAHPIVSRIEDALPPVRADSRSLLQVLRNLATNAVKYSPAGGQVTVSASVPAPGKVLIEVADHGIGIAPEDLPRLFAKFQRIESAETEGVRGTGLGLYICRKIIEDHGGEIGVSSRPGEGSTFHITLPAAR